MSLIPYHCDECGKLFYRDQAKFRSKRKFFFCSLTCSGKHSMKMHGSITNEARRKAACSRNSGYERDFVMADFRRGMCLTAWKIAHLNNIPIPKALGIVDKLLKDGIIGRVEDTSPVPVYRILQNGLHSGEVQSALNQSTIQWQKMFRMCKKSAPRGKKGNQGAL